MMRSVTKIIQKSVIRFSKVKVRNLGRKSLEEVLAKLKELGLQLNQGEE
jgi:DNA-directed RNA polymerase alpha subunit